MKPKAKHMALSSTEIDAYDRIKDDETCPRCGRSHKRGQPCPCRKK